jgi:hypothetical protein
MLKVPPPAGTRPVQDSDKSRKLSAQRAATQKLKTVKIEPGVFEQ